MAQSILMLDPETGALLPSQATLSDCFVVLASQVFPYVIPRLGDQHTEWLKEAFVLDCQSYAIGLSLLTAAERGQFHRIDVIGNVAGGGSSKIT